MTIFRVGMKVVCVNDDLYAFRIVGRKYAEICGLDGLTKGVVYTVRDIFLNPVTEKMNIRLVEIVRPLGCAMTSFLDIEPGYVFDRFRPVLERKTSIEVFRSLLNPSKVGEHA